MTRVGPQGLVGQNAALAGNDGVGRARSASMSGPFFDVDLGNARPPASSSWKDKVSAAFDKIALAGKVAVGCLKEGLMKADEAILQPMQKKLSSAWTSVANFGAGLAERARNAMQSREADGTAQADAVTQAASEPAGPSIDEVMHTAYDKVMAAEGQFKPEGEHMALRGKELSESNKVMRDLAAPVVKGTIDAVVDNIIGQGPNHFSSRLLNDSAARQEHDHGAADSHLSDPSACGQRLLDNVAALNLAIFGDGSDAALQNLADSLPEDFCKISAAKREAVHDMQREEKFEKAFVKLLGGQDISLRLICSFMSDRANQFDREKPEQKANQDNINMVANFFQAAAAGPEFKGAKADELLPSHAQQFQDARAFTHDCMMRLADKVAERGQQGAYASIHAHKAETMEFDAFV